MTLLLEKMPTSADEQEKHAATIRSMWEQENTMMGVRFQWFTTIQGLLFTSLGLAWRDKATPVIVVLSLLGIVVALSIMSSFWLGRLARKELQEWWSTYLPSYNGPPLAGYIEEKVTLARILRPWRILPCTFLLAWAFIAWFALYHHY